MPKVFVEQPLALPGSANESENSPQTENTESINYGGNNVFGPKHYWQILVWPKKICQTVQLGLILHLSHFIGLFPIPRELLDDMTIPQGMQVTAQNHRHTYIKV